MGASEKDANSSHWAPRTAWIGGSETSSHPAIWSIWQPLTVCVEATIAGHKHLPTDGNETSASSGAMEKATIYLPSLEWVVPTADVSAPLQASSTVLVEGLPNLPSDRRHTELKRIGRIVGNRRLQRLIKVAGSPSPVLHQQDGHAHLRADTANQRNVGSPMNITDRVDMPPNRFVPSDLPAIQRVIIELPEETITADPEFLPRAERRNQYWAANPPRPGWPYDDGFRLLWSRGEIDEFAQEVRDYQIDVMGVSLEDADGILGPRTAASLETSPPSPTIFEGETHEVETGTSSPAEALGETTPESAEADIGEVPEWIMSGATETPWPVHSTVYQEAMASGGIGIEGAAPTWEGFLGQMGSMDFLGHSVVGHTAFLRRLDTAQRYLRSNYPDVSERVLVPSVNLPGTRSQWRAAERLTSSPHLFGMAIDISGGQNPWMSNPAEEERNTLYAWIIWRATWLMSRGSPITPAESHRLAGSRSSASSRGEPQSTEVIWQYFHEANDATLAYLGLVDSREAVAERLRSLGEPSPLIQGERYIGDYVPADIPIERLRLGPPALEDWMQVIRHDRSNWPNRGRDETVSGFMNLRRELVVALRDQAGLQWGACDLGERQSGDMMHFALDPDEFFQFRERVRRRLAEAQAGMSPEVRRAEQQEERRRQREMGSRVEAERRRPR